MGVTFHDNVAYYSSEGMEIIYEENQGEFLPFGHLVFPPRYDSPKVTPASSICK